jgi:hypothetical protein
MKYLLLIYGNEREIDDEARSECYTEATALAQDLKASGHYVGAAPLHPTNSAVTVRVRAGKRQVTAGPFAETHEQLGGYFLVEAKDQEEAIAIAERIPSARWGTIEVRPVLEIPGLPG